MTDSFVTQCPHCQTSFRVTHHQLSVARGVVRCGNCLQVFNAAKQLLEQNRAASDRGVATPAEPAPAAPPLPAAPPVAELPAADEDDWAVTAEELDALDLDGCPDLLPLLFDRHAPWTLLVASNDPRVIARCDRAVSVADPDLVPLTGVA